MRAEFDETLVTGNDMIDSQHKELIDRINQLLESSIKNLLTELISFWKAARKDRERSRL